MYNQAKAWGVRPSSLAGIEQEYHAYCFDEAIGAWGMFITGELEKIEGKTDKEVARKRHSRLLQLIEAPDKLRFRSLRKGKNPK